MPFIGNQPALSYTSFAKQDFTTSATTSYTLDNPVANANELALFINFVRQEPTTAYSASGTTLTLTEPTSSSDDMYCVYLGKAVQTVNPPNASVGASQIVDASITSGKLASGVLPTNTPAFYSYQSSNQSITSGATTKINFQTEILDSDNNFASSTFTPTTAGYYLITVGLKCFSGSAEYFLVLRRNGSNYHTLRNEVFTNYQLSGSAIVYANGSGDYFDVTFFQNSGSTRTTTATQLNTWFSGFRIIGV